MITTDYAALCAAKQAVHDARNLPERFKAVIDYQAELYRFVDKHPRVLRLGAEALMREEVGALGLVS